MDEARRLIVVAAVLVRLSTNCEREQFHQRRQEKGEGRRNAPTPARNLGRGGGDEPGAQRADARRTRLA